MAGKENSGVEFADADLFEGAPWLFTPLPRQNPHAGLGGEFLHCVEKIGARVALLDPAEHDRFCAWISHLPQMISTAARRRAGRGVRAGCTTSRYWRPRTSRPDSHLRLAVFHVARCSHHQQKEHRRRSSQAGAASGAHPREPGHEGTCGRVRPGARTKKSKDKSKVRSQIEEVKPGREPRVASREVLAPSLGHLFGLAARGS